MWPFGYFKKKREKEEQMRRREEENAHLQNWNRNVLSENVKDVWKRIEKRRTT